MSITKSLRSAVVIIPPETIWPQIQDIRSNYDRAYSTWMPHINLLFPFVEDSLDGRSFHKAASDIQDKLFFVKPFKIRFTKESLNFFIHGKKGSVHLKPLMSNDSEEEDENEDLVDDSGESEDDVEEPPPSLSDLADAEDDSPDVGNNDLPSVQLQARDSNTDFSSEEPNGYLPTSYSTQSEDHQLASILSQHTECYVRPTHRANKSPVDIFATVPVPNEFRNLPAPSLDSLRDAVWGDLSNQPKPKHLNHDLSPATPTNKKVTFAQVKKDEIKTRKEEQNLIKQANSQPMKNITPDVQTPKEPTTTPVKTGNKQDIPACTVTTNPRKVMLQRETELEEFTPVSALRKKPSKKQRKKKRAPKPPTIHPELNELQSVLQRCYPTFNELSIKSDHGFQPHLTLGQFDQRDTNAMIEQFQAEWEDVEFTVADIHLISRRGMEMHQIQQTVHLGFG